MNTYNLNGLKLEEMTHLIEYVYEISQDDAVALIKSILCNIQSVTPQAKKAAEAYGITFGDRL